MQFWQWESCVWWCIWGGSVDKLPWLKEEFFGEFKCTEPANSAVDCGPQRQLYSTELKGFRSLKISYLRCGPFPAFLSGNTIHIMIWLELGNHFIFKILIFIGLFPVFPCTSPARLFLSCTPQYLDYSNSHSGLGITCHSILHIQTKHQLRH